MMHRRRSVRFAIPGDATPVAHLAKYQWADDKAGFATDRGLVLALRRDFGSCQERIGAATWPIRR
jgi:hypothetical protein